MPYEFRLRRTIEFVETDMAGIMHFSNFFRLMEATEAAFFRTLGLSIFPENPVNSVGWPRVHAECDFRSPLRFEDDVEIQLLVREKGEKSLSYTFIFRKLSDGSSREVARGGIVTACVIHDAESGKMKAVPLPRHVSELIQTAPKELLA
jgi:acyl-CoA thioester hydrolase